MSEAGVNPFADEDATLVGRRLKSIFGGSIGNLIEWYDFYIYVFFATYFAKAFFPSSDPTAQLLNTFGIYAIGFVIRPVGGWILGAYADRSGRRAALTLSVVLMCVGSLIIGVVPTYASIGAAAPLLLLLARLVQGISLGGEYGTSATYLSEIAQSRHRGFYSSFQYVTLIGGQILGSAVLLLMQQAFTPGEFKGMMSIVLVHVEGRRCRASAPGSYQTKRGSVATGLSSATRASISTFSMFSPKCCS